MPSLNCSIADCTRGNLTFSGHAHEINGPLPSSIVTVIVLVTLLSISWCACVGYVVIDFFFQSEVRQFYRKTFLKKGNSSDTESASRLGPSIIGRSLSGMSGTSSAVAPAQIVTLERSGLITPATSVSQSVSAELSITSAPVLQSRGVAFQANSGRRASVSISEKRNCTSSTIFETIELNGSSTSLDTQHSAGKVCPANIELEEKVI